MKISDVLRTLKAEMAFRRTPSGRPLTEFAIEALGSALEDVKNQDQEAIKCLNCGLVVSSLLVPEGCCSCGSKDLTTELTKADVL